MDVMGKMGEFVGILPKWSIESERVGGIGSKCRFFSVPGTTGIIAESKAIGIKSAGAGIGPSDVGCAGKEFGYRPRICDRRRQGTRTR